MTRPLNPLPLTLLLALPLAAAAADEPLNGHWSMIDEYCVACHNFQDWAGGIAFDTMAPEAIVEDAAVWEETLRKLRGRMMPPAGEPRPTDDDLAAFVAALEGHLDAHAAAHPNPGSVALHRLNRTEYANAVADLLGIDVDVRALLPSDDESSGFDNIASVLQVSPSFMDQYITAARQVTRQAVGDPDARSRSSIYRAPPGANRNAHVEGLPLGTVGGMVVEHWFPADGEYEFTIEGLAGGAYVWGVLEPNTVIVTVDGERIFEGELGGEEDMRAIDQLQTPAIEAINSRFERIRHHVKAGPRQVGVTFLARTFAESDEVLHPLVPGEVQPLGPLVDSLEIRGPARAAGLSETPSRRQLFVCYPASAAEESACAEQILSNVARRAFRSPVSSDDLAGAMRFYRAGNEEGGFEAGIQQGLMAILASPRFLYRAQTPPPEAMPGDNFEISDLELASRLAFFLWSRPPDDELLELAADGRLSDDAVLEAQVQRMLADPRSHSLVTNFAFQWLHVHGLDQVDPDPYLYPEYTADLHGAFEREIELFIASIFREDRSVVDLITADHTYLNERLAMHYGIADVRGERFRRVTLEDSNRHGLLGKGAVLMSTSYANRTSPVLRGEWILEKLLGTPSSAPPPDVEAFPEPAEGEPPVTVRARLEMHRDAPGCRSCHAAIDPLGLALENFNAVGQWRDRDRDVGSAIDASGQLVDGTPLHGPDDLRRALASQPGQFAQNFTERLMIFALGRNLEPFDMPTVRAITREAAADDYRLSALVRGVINSRAFRMERLLGEDEILAME